MDPHELIPPHEVVRAELARNYEDARLLRRLLRLSEDAAIERSERKSKGGTKKGAPSCQ